MSGRRDEGSMIPLIAFYVIVAATLVLIVTDASRYYLARRSLQSAADAAALASAQQVATPGLYDGHDELLVAGDICQAVGDYADANHLADHFDRLAITGYPDGQPGSCVAVGAPRITVVAQDLVHLPLVSILGVVNQRFADGAPLTVTAHAALRCDTC